MNLDFFIALIFTGLSSFNCLAAKSYTPEVFRKGTYSYQHNGKTMVGESANITVDQSLDESNKFQFSITSNTKNGSLRIGFSEMDKSDMFEPITTPKQFFTRGVEVVVNGKKIPFRRVESISFIESSSLEAAAIADLSKKSQIEIRFHGEKIGEYSYDPNKKELVRLMAPRQLSSFDVRQFSERNEGYLEEWKQRKVTISKISKPVGQIDLHTHFGGALRGEVIMEVSKKNKTLYPTDLLDEFKIPYSPQAVVTKDGQKFIPLVESSFRYRGFEQLQESLSIPVTSTIDFNHMENIYRLRGPLVKGDKVFPIYLEELAKDYKRMGVKYAELSISDIIKPEYLEQAHKVLPEIEKKTGVKMRFMVALWRHSDKKINLDVIDKVVSLKNDPYIVGVDFMGHETNSTDSFADELKRLAEYRKAENPHFQIRVHAGENTNYLDNIKEAIRLGATRVGHGVYGVDNETLALAKKNNVIIEFNTNSNLALQNIDRKAVLPVKRYLDAGVRVTIGTDGHGLYNTSSHSEEAVMRSLGLNKEEFNKIRSSNTSYTREMTKDFKIKNTEMKNTKSRAEILKNIHKKLADGASCHR